MPNTNGPHRNEPDSLTPPRATPQGTAGYCARHPLPSPPIRLGNTGLSVSRWGFGSYRIGPRYPRHREALELALTSGCNLIDTSANYTDGGSETLIGQVLAGLFASGKLRRDELVVVSKAGYLQGSNLEHAREREAAGRPFGEVVEFSDGLWHCISPEFLEDQLTRSLGRLGLESLDVLLLHNPEYFLKGGGSHDEYYRRIEKAFRHLETEADRGRIGFYGISSNSFPDPRESPEYTSLETVLEIARRISPRSRFAVIQFPFNLAEPGAAFETNNTGKTVTELAAARGIGTLVNRPLNAFARDKLIRIADVRAAPSPAGGAREPAPEAEFEESLREAIDHEARMPEAVAGWRRDLQWAHVIHRNLERITDQATWSDLYHGQIIPDLKTALTNARAADAAWAEQYELLTSRLFAAVSALLSRQDRVFQQGLRNELVKAAQALAGSPTLSRRALRIYESIPGIDCVLVGMRDPDYVRDVLGTEPPIAVEPAIDALESVQEYLASTLR